MHWMACCAPYGCTLTRRWQGFPMLTPASALPSSCLRSPLCRLRLPLWRMLSLGLVRSRMSSRPLTMDLRHPKGKAKNLLMRPECSCRQAPKPVPKFLHNNMGHSLKPYASGHP